MKTDWKNIVLDLQSYLSTQLKPDNKEIDNTHLIVIGKIKGELDSLVSTYTTED